MARTSTAQDRHGTADGAEALTTSQGLMDRAVRELVTRALGRGKILLAFQPIVDACQPDRPAFFEGLIRLTDDSDQIIPARDFITQVEGGELGRQIDCAALELGLAELAVTPDLRLAVNMSARSIGHPRWTETLARGLSASPLIAERLILEITESSALARPGLVRAFMSELQEMGVCFALDDFGAGFATFRYFREFRFDILKIDGQFSRNIANDPDNQVLMRALISVGRHFDMMTVAEAVETAEDAQYLRRAGLDCLQGYHFAAPTIWPSWRQRRTQNSA